MSITRISITCAFLAVFASAAASADTLPQENIATVSHGGGVVDVEKGESLTLYASMPGGEVSDGWECVGEACTFDYGIVEDFDTVPAAAGTSTCSECHAGHGCIYLGCTGGGVIRIRPKCAGEDCPEGT